MWKTTTAIGLILIVVSGCQSPQTVLQTLQRSDQCFTAPVARVGETAETTSESGRVEEYVQLGLSRNPRIQEAQHRIDAIQHRVPQVLSLPDPMVNTNTHLAPVETAAGRQAFSLGVSQKFTNAERRATRAAIVSDEAAAAEADLANAQLEIAESIRTACYQLLFIRKSIEITNDDRESLEQIAEVVLRQYEVKESVTQQDVLNVQTEQSKIENQITELKQKEKSFQARLARLLHVDPRSNLQISDQLGTANAYLNVDELIAQAVETRPDLQSQLAVIRRDRRKIQLAHLEEKPDFTVGLNWIATSSDGISPVANGDDALLLGIGFNLPVYKSRIRAGICEAQSNRLASESRLASLQDQASEEVFDLVAKLESTRETLTLIQEDIIPKAERTLEVSIDEYAADSVTYVQLIANWRSVLRYRVTEANLQAQYQQQLASLARSIGQLNPIQTEAVVTEIMQPDFEGEMDEPQLGEELNEDVNEEIDRDDVDAEKTLESR
jgi:outer membrane protein TolC